MSDYLRWYKRHFMPIHVSKASIHDRSSAYAMACLRTCSHADTHTHEREGCYAHTESSVLPQHARTCTCARCRWPYTGYTVNTHRGEHAARWQHMLRAGALAPVLRPGSAEGGRAREFVGGAHQWRGASERGQQPARLCEGRWVARAASRFAAPLPLSAHGERAPTNLRLGTTQSTRRG